MMYLTYLQMVTSGIGDATKELIALVFLSSASASMAFALSNSGGRDWGYYEAMIKEGK